MVANKTSLSAGELLRAVLIEDAEVSQRVNSIFPVVKDTAELPYIVYRRIRLEQQPVKPRGGADTIGVEILCYTAKYTEGVELAEAVRSALDNRCAESSDLNMRSCYLLESEEDWENDAYIQTLVFNVKI